MLSESTNLPMEILLVEDGLLDARITIHALRRSGIRHRLTLVRTVQEAIDFLARRGVFARAPQPDLLLLDLTLPDGNGVEILDEMRVLHADRSSRTPVVILSASDDDQKPGRPVPIHSQAGPLRSVVDSPRRARLLATRRRTEATVVRTVRFEAPDCSFRRAERPVSAGYHWRPDRPPSSSTP